MTQRQTNQQRKQILLACKCNATLCVTATQTIRYTYTVELIKIDGCLFVFPVVQVQVYIFKVTTFSLGASKTLFNCIDIVVSRTLWSVSLIINVHFGLCTVSRHLETDSRAKALSREFYRSLIWLNEEWDIFRFL